MTGMTHLNQRLAAAGRVAPVTSWPATDDTAGTRNRLHHVVTTSIPATHEVKPAFQATTRRPMEGSS